MKEDIVIEVKNLYKKFPTSLKRSLAYGTVDTFRNFIGFPSNQGKLRKTEFWALKDISFELKSSEVLGIIGENGSGKSTLLRVLNGIFPPDRGTVKLRGNIGGLIAVGAGFHPYMTGRENIYLNGTILGMKKKEIENKFDEIVAFAEIGDFLDAPVATYSSGMKVRLGFAIAIHVDPEILLIDEVLSVGDITFRNKSMRYMSALQKKSKAVIFISHNLEQIRNLCDRVIVLDKGSLVFDGETNQAISVYESLSREHRAQTLTLENTKKLKVKGAVDSDIIELLDTGITDLNRNKISTIEVDQGFIHFFEFNLKLAQEELIFSSGIVDEKGNVLIWHISNDMDMYHFENLQPGKYRLEFQYIQHHLMPGVYTTSHGIRNNKTYETFQRITAATTFRVESKVYPERGAIRAQYQINLVMQ